MRHRSILPMCGAMLGLLACGDGGVSPDPGTDASRAAASFEQIADSVEGAGYSPAAEALRHAAEIVRLTGRATPVTLTIDGTARSFLAVGEQLDFPNLACTWPSDSGVVVPGDSVVPLTAPSGPESASGECTVIDTTSMRTLIAWEPERMAEVVRVVSDVGSTVVEPTVPDVMAGLPTTTAPEPGGTPGAPDSAVSGGGGGSSAGFMGEYLVRDVGSWWAVEGRQSNALLDIVGSCTADHATFDWAVFGCEAARLRFDFSMRVEPVRYEPLMGRLSLGDPEGTHELSMAASDVDGVRLTIEAWTPPPLPPPTEPPPGPPVPIDSTLVEPPR